MEPELTYRSAFERLWDLRSPNTVSNGKPEHAASIIAVFFERSEKTVRIFCKDLKSEVYDSPEVLSAFKAAALRGVNIAIVVQEGVKGRSEFYDLAKTLLEKHEKVHIRLYNGCEDPLQKTDYNFACVDGHAFRFEPDRNVLAAVAAAWDEHLTGRLEMVFKSIVELITTPHASSLGIVAGIIQ